MKIKWYWWYMWAIVALTVFAFRDHPADLVYGIPGNLLLYWLPARLFAWYWTVGYPKYMAPRPPAKPTSTAMGPK